MKSFRDLEIYRESKRLAIEIHNLSLSLPRYEWSEEGRQLRRSSKAIAALIAEGYGRRRYKADFIKYLTYGQAECDEVTVHLDLVFETKTFASKEVYERLRQDYDLLGKRINKFIQWVEAHEIG